MSLTDKELYKDFLGIEEIEDLATLIKQAQEDVKEGRTISSPDFKKSLSERKQACLDEEEEVQLHFTFPELYTINQILGFVALEDTVNSILDKVESYLDEELIDESFGKVELVMEEPLPLFKDKIMMQKNNFGLKINK